MRTLDDRLHGLIFVHEACFAQTAQRNDTAETLCTLRGEQRQRRFLLYHKASENSENTIHNN